MVARVRSAKGRKPRRILIEQRWSSPADDRTVLLNVCVAVCVCACCCMCVLLYVCVAVCA